MTTIDRNELNRENLHFWADLQAIEDESKTVQQVLAKLCFDDYRNTISGDDSDSLYDEATSFAWDGTKGFKDYTIEESLDYLMGEVENYDGVDTITDFIGAIQGDEDDNDND